MGGLFILLGYCGYSVISKSVEILFKLLNNANASVLVTLSTRPHFYVMDLDSFH